MKSCITFQNFISCCVYSDYYGETILIVFNIILDSFKTLVYSTKQQLFMVLTILAEIDGTVQSNFQK